VAGLEGSGLRRNLGPAKLKAEFCGGDDV
jgi:hypothetical protein